MSACPSPNGRFSEMVDERAYNEAQRWNAEDAAAAREWARQQKRVPCPVCGESMKKVVHQQNALRRAGVKRFVTYSFQPSCRCIPGAWNDFALYRFLKLRAAQQPSQPTPSPQIESAGGSGITTPKGVRWLRFTTSKRKGDLQR